MPDPCPIVLTVDGPGERWVFSCPPDRTDELFAAILDQLDAGRLGTFRALCLVYDLGLAAGKRLAGAGT